MTEMQPLQGRIEQLLPGGEALVRTGQGVLLVANGVPGDVAEVEALGRRRGASRGRIVHLLESSAMRVPAGCDAAADCGGCAMQYVHIEAQPEIKSAWVFNQFESFMDAESEWIAVVDAPSVGMRRRARWHCGRDEGGTFLGFRARSSHRAVRAARCPVVHPDMDAVRLAIEPILPPGIESIYMLRLYDGMHLVFESATGVQPDTLDGCLVTITEVPVDIQPWLRHGEVLVPLTRPVRTFHDRLPAGEGSVELAVGPEDFVQGHARGNASILRQIQAWAGNPRRIVDLFCGIGNLSLPLAASRGSVVYGADVAASSIRQARANAANLGVRGAFEACNLFDGVKGEQYAGADVLLLDPPRKGAKAVCAAMGRLLPERIIMVNCDIAAGARDAALLRERGFRLHALRALDIFPFSGHVEAMSCWRR
jgi:23S rRNA (uracil1939-C5)-methyltransferase